MKSILVKADTIEKINELISHCKTTGYCSFDFETNKTEYYADDFLITCLSVSFQPGCSWVIPLGHKESIFKKNWIKILTRFGKAVLEDINIIKIGWNLQFELNCCRRYNIYPKGRLFDGMLAKYLLDETRPNDLKSMVVRFIPEMGNYEKEIDDLVKKYGWGNVPLEPLCKYNGLDSDLEFRLYLKFEYLLIEKGMYFIYRNLLMMATRVLSESAYHGVNLNVERLKELSIKYGDILKDIEEKLSSHPTLIKYQNKIIKAKKKTYINSIKNEIEELEKLRDKSIDKKEIQSINRKISNRNIKVNNFICNIGLSKKEMGMMEPFNFGSPAQLKDLLFLNKHGFNFEVVKYTTDKYKNETDNPSTAEDVLDKLKLLDNSGFIELMLKRREIGHIISNFIEGYLEKVDKGKLHPSYLIHGTTSGRLSSRNPNAQQVPRVKTNPDIKPLFIPSPGKILIQLDYSQAELRVMAAMAKEEEMLKWFAEGRDIHLSSACKKYNFDYDIALKILNNPEHKDNGLWTIRRKQAKQINFGIIYGQGAKMLSESLATPEMPVSKEMAQEFLNDFFTQFPKIKKFIRKQNKFAESHGYVVSPFGRKRRLPEIYSPNFFKVAEAQRQSVNAPIQGCASDYALFSSILIWEKIKKGELPIEMKQLITVHDSLIYEIYPENVHKVVKIVRPICENPETKKWFKFELKGITMAVDFEVGKNWGSLSKYDEKIDYVDWYKNH